MKKTLIIITSYLIFINVLVCQPKNEYPSSIIVATQDVQDHPVYSNLGSKTMAIKDGINNKRNAFEEKYGTDERIGKALSYSNNLSSNILMSAGSYDPIGAGLIFLGAGNKLAADGIDYFIVGDIQRKREENKKQTKEFFEKSLDLTLQQIAKQSDNAVEFRSNLNKYFGNPELLKAIEASELNGSLESGILKSKIDYLTKNSEKSFGELKNKVDQQGDNILTMLEKTNEKQDKIIELASKTIAIEQENIASLTVLQELIKNNQAEITNNIGDVKSKIEQNIKLTEFLRNATEPALNMLQSKLDQKILSDAFEKSPLALRIEELSKPGGGKYGKLFTLGEIKTQLECAKSLKRRQDIITVCEAINTWGNVAKEAINTFCKNCPNEISQSIEIGTSISNIVGNITSGNYAGALMSAIGLFKKPGPSPEMKMLLKINAKLDTIRAEMHEGFNNVHKHLFSIEDRLNNVENSLIVIDDKLDRLSRFIYEAQVQNAENLKIIDSKLSTIILQNECTQDLILKLQSDSKLNICYQPMLRLITEAKRNNLTTLKNYKDFFATQSCKPCIKELITLASTNLGQSPIFRYSDCPNTISQSSHSLDKQFRRIANFYLKDSISYNNGYVTTSNSNYKRQFSKLGLFTLTLLDNKKFLYRLRSKPEFIYADSILVSSGWGSKKIKNPKSRSQAKEEYDKNTKDIIKKTNPIPFNQEDISQLRDHKKVIMYIENFLSFYPFIELFDENNETITGRYPDNEFIRLKNDFLKNCLDNLIDLCNRTIAQYSLLSGDFLGEELVSIMNTTTRPSSMLGTLPLKWAEYVKLKSLLKDAPILLNSIHREAYKKGNRYIDTINARTIIYFDYWPENPIRDTTWWFGGLRSYRDSLIWDKPVIYNKEMPNQLFINNFESPCYELQIVRDKLIDKLLEINILNSEIYTPEINDTDIKEMVKYTFRNEIYPNSNSKIVGDWKAVNSTDKLVLNKVGSGIWGQNNANENIDWNYNPLKAELIIYTENKKIIGKIKKVDNSNLSFTSIENGKVITYAFKK